MNTRQSLLALVLAASGAVLIAPAALAPAPAHAQATARSINFAGETIGAEPKAFLPVVGTWRIGEENGKKLIVVDGTRWARGQASAGLADKARALYGERYTEFLDNVQAYAYFPIAVAQDVTDFREGAISFRFKGVAGRIDQAAGILFNLKPNGDYLTLRANPLEDNLVLWKYVRGKRSSVKWIRNTPAPSQTWHTLRLEVKGSEVRGYLNGKLYLTHMLDAPVSGRVGLWSKADSHVLFDDVRVERVTP